jgi:Ca2+-binding RTX toxin-like protein
MRVLRRARRRHRQHPWGTPWPDLFWLFATLPLAGDDALLGGPGTDRLGGGDQIDTCNGGGGEADVATACETVWRVP